MKWPFAKIESWFLLLFTSYILFVISQWSDYTPCAAPIHYFLTISQVILLVVIISLFLINDPETPNLAKNIIKRLILFIINPLCMFLPVQGIIWQVANMSGNQNCPSVGWSSMLTWAWIFIMLMAGGLFTMISYLNLKNYWKVYQYKRQMIRLNQLAANGDYQVLNGLLLGNEDANHKFGLVACDIEKLETRDFSQSLGSMLTGSEKETCPICFEDFKEGDKITSLPKCEHTFHPKCISSWLTKVPLCPMCRGNVRTGLYSDESQSQDLEDPMQEQKTERLCI